ncbi:hypothetical protein BIV23_36580 [Streptomyces monashensis]|uniref:Uncharacterized protein n=1 Tax=Streptomyces monashensis TaxID=1678012 RepID=A0A1S2PJU8_9ACTN|nr:hypothetical protein BIV23_36580 [Streptomyces monashensis]
MTGAHVMAGDTERRLARDEPDRLSRSGLLAVTVPAGRGGTDVAAAGLAGSSDCSARPTRALPGSRTSTSPTPM